MALDVGTAAPDFTLKNQNNEEVSLADLEGRKAVIAFMPFAFSGVCTGEICAIRDNYAQLEELDATPVIISVDHRFSNGAWAAQEGIEFNVLSDYWPKGAVAEAYDTFNDQVGCANRATYILDADGIIRSVFTTDAIPTPRNFDDYVEALGSI